ncbi:MAG TPA: NAD(P)H-dependent oxidoreductase [Mesorhizobium sp.]|jgi:FMN reductase|uniref:NADPH-dependent FMN reductase n=1 Tax=Mesorhizobium sp. TaxID=1871066 RepID=UPI002DDCAAD4|nr:NAD(P)H-dependent oxidoreductase [Mesorhizobium sp.]HEV2505251.1 NAD(P)H-dependent oxidoreductase [Mesorhizobium sp.]
MDTSPTTAPRVSLVIGNPKPMSRTRTLAEQFTDQLVEHPASDRAVIDLAEQAEALFPPRAELLAPVYERLSGSDLLVVASPTYKASYTGLTKLFFDQMRPNALQGVVAIPLMTGASAAHSLAVEFHLAPLLRELGAVVPTSGVYFIINETEDLEAAVSAAVARQRSQLALLRAPWVAGGKHAGNAVDGR